VTSRDWPPRNAETHTYNKLFLAWLCVVSLFWPAIPIVIFALSSWARGVPFRLDLSKIHSSVAWLVLVISYLFFISVTVFAISQRKDVILTDESISSSIFGHFVTTIKWRNADRITIRTFRSPSRGIDTTTILVKAKDGKLVILSDRIDGYRELLERLVKIASDDAIQIIRQ
jgi:hypothetical protein